jgi:hypothetical protein
VVSVCAGKKVLDKTAIICGEGAKGIMLCWFIFVIMFYFFKINRSAVLLYQRAKEPKGINP